MGSFDYWHARAAFERWHGGRDLDVSDRDLRDDFLYAVHR